jgi:hypothetical protein
MSGADQAVSKWRPGNEAEGGKMAPKGDAASFRCGYLTTRTEHGDSLVRLAADPPIMRPSTREWPMKPITNRSKWLSLAYLTTVSTSCPGVMIT